MGWGDEQQQIYFLGLHTLEKSTNACKFSFICNKWLWNCFLFISSIYEREEEENPNQLNRDC